VIETKLENGFLKEFGPTTALAKPEFLDLVEELGMEDRISRPSKSAKNRFLARKRKNNRWKLYPAPTNPLSAAAWPVISAAAKARVFREPLIPCTLEADQDVYTFMSRRFGKQVTERVIAPMLSGIWAADIKKLSTRSSLPALWKLEQEHGSLTRGGFSKLRKKLFGSNESSKPRRKRGLVTFHDGMTELPLKLASLLPDDAIMLHSAVHELHSYPDYVKLLVRCAAGANPEATISLESQVIQAKRLVIASPAWMAAEIIRGLSPDLADKLEQIPYAPLGILHVAIKKADCSHPLNGFGFLCPPKDNDVLLGAIFNSSLFDNRAPAGYHMLTCYCGGAVNPTGANTHLPHVRDRALEELGRLIGLSKTPEILSAYHWDRAIPNYPVNHYLLENEVDYFREEQPNIYFLANWLRGIGVPDRIREATLLADKLLNPE
jgi:oxygen-dependent protoporphyrinogen oxidase